MSTAATRTTSNIVPFPTGLEEKIRRRAFEIFMSRGATHGRAVEDWLQAEAELAQPPVSVAPAKSSATVKKPRAGKK